MFYMWSLNKRSPNQQIRAFYFQKILNLSYTLSKCIQTVCVSITFRDFRIQKEFSSSLFLGPGLISSQQYTGLRTYREFFQSVGKYLPVTQAYVHLACTRLLLIKNTVPSKFSIFALKKEGPKGDSQFYRNNAHQLVDSNLALFGNLSIRVTR